MKLNSVLLLAAVVTPEHDARDLLNLRKVDFRPMHMMSDVNQRRSK